MLSTAASDGGDQRHPGAGPPGPAGPGGPPGPGGPGGPPDGPPHDHVAAAPRRRLPRWLRTLIVIVAIPLYVAGSIVYVRGSSESSVAEAAGDHRLPVSGAEMKFDSPLKIEPGWTTISLRNDGGLAHQASLYRLHDGINGNDLAQALRADRDAWNGKADPIGGIGGIPAGKTQDVALDLSPGQYLITCFLRGGSAAGASHVNFGMSRVLEVQAASSSSPSTQPSTSGEFILRDDKFEFPAGFAGEGVFKVTNAGTQPHELSIVRLAPGKTKDDFLAFMQAAALAEEGGPKPSGAPPFSNAGGFTILDPGMAGVMMIDLEPGSYLAADFIPDPTKDGLPHFMLGMLVPFEVTQ